MLQHTPLYGFHCAQGARLTDFAGWEMPVMYSSVLEEHRAVREAAGLFDVSHMTVLELRGAGVKEALRHLLANDVALLRPGQALYSAMLNEQGGILDDLIVYAPEDPAVQEVGPEGAGPEEVWRVIVNCATHDKDLSWMRQQFQGRDLQLLERLDVAMLALQGPQARERLLAVLPVHAQAQVNQLPVFFGRQINGWFVARTGYTGEDGFEIILPAAAAENLASALVQQGVRLCGLAARDTLRLEAGMNLYGQDMTEADSPLTSNMAWTVRWDHEFIGRSALLTQKAQGVQQALVGLLLRDRGVLRAHMVVQTASGAEGCITSGTFAPTLGHGIALARLPLPLSAPVTLQLRGRTLTLDLVRPPFVRHGKCCYQAY